MDQARKLQKARQNPRVLIQVWFYLFFCFQCFNFIKYEMIQKTSSNVDFIFQKMIPVELLCSNLCFIGGFDKETVGEGFTGELIF